MLKLTNAQVFNGNPPYLILLHNRGTRQTERAYLTPETDHWYRVQWVEDSSTAYDPHVLDCWAWVEGHTLFLPSDGQTTRGQRLDDGTLDPSAGWYDPATGLLAVIGVPGCTLAKL
jgi:hypothetical protein